MSGQWDKLDEIERRLEREAAERADYGLLGPLPEDPTPEEIHERYQQAAQRPDVDSGEAYMQLLEAAEEHGMGPTLPTDAPSADVTGSPAADDASAADAEDMPELPDDVPDDLTPSGEAEARDLLQQEQELEAEIDALDADDGESA